MIIFCKTRKKNVDGELQNYHAFVASGSSVVFLVESGVDPDATGMPGQSKHQKTIRLNLIRFFQVSNHENARFGFLTYILVAGSSMAFQGRTPSVRSRRRRG